MLMKTIAIIIITCTDFNGTIGKDPDEREQGPGEV